MFDNFRKNVLSVIKKKFDGIAGQDPRPQYGWYSEQKCPFNSFGEQVIYFATSGSSGYMKDGIYRDISGAKILEGEYIEVVSQSGLKALMDAGTLEKMWRGEKVDLVTGESIK